eukprot:TRINITY_DN29862_c0_g1_i1.p1 TRINITY_DN29862_c0_g1~~TRINITY_DN29862_c0_g1_i1.p1  ORF type:complete len:772 (+),score=175.11 TRINITY_DN29862_c0_g1_i1:162-2477(+)
MAVSWSNNAALQRALARKTKSAGKESKEDAEAEEAAAFDPVTGQAITATQLKAAASGGSRTLSEVGTAKLRRYVTEATTIEELADIESALDEGKICKRLSKRLQLVETDFVPLPSQEQPEEDLLAAFAEPPPEYDVIDQPLAASPALVDTVPVPQQVASNVVAPPLATLSLTPAGLAKVRHAIATASDMRTLQTLDNALNQGDIARLRDMLRLQPADLGVNEVVTSETAKADKGNEAAEAGSTDASDDDSDEDDSEYDPFATEPNKPGVISAPASLKRPRAKKVKGKKAREGGSVLGALASAYEESSSDEDEDDIPTLSTTGAAKASKRAAKARRKASAEAAAGTADGQAGNQLAWPIEWAWLLTRSMGHAHFRPPTRSASSKCAKERSEEDKLLPPKKLPRMVAIATSLVYVGDATSGFDTRHLGRVVAVNERGRVLVDVLVKPRAQLLDARDHLTGFSKDALSGPKAVDFETACSKLLEVLRQDTLLIGYKLNSDLEALQLWHGPLIDTSLLFTVESRKQFQYHPLRYIAAHVLKLDVCQDGPFDALENARLCLRLAQYEAKQQTPTPAFPPATGDPTQLLVKHIPHAWGTTAASRVLGMCPGASQDVRVNWLLEESDPTNWRGEATLVFPDSTARDAAFQSLVGLTDVHVQWEDAPRADAPPLGALLTEQALIKAFSAHGMVVCARLPRKPITREPQSFAFVSFVHRQDAQRVSRMAEVEVELTPTWTLSLKPRLAKYGNDTDKRIAARASDSADSEWCFDWVHVIRR